jgi:hypothetical protein
MDQRTTEELTLIGIRLLRKIHVDYYYPPPPFIYFHQIYPRNLQSNFFSTSPTAEQKLFFSFFSHFFQVTRPRSVERKRMDAWRMERDSARDSVTNCRSDNN